MKSYRLGRSITKIVPTIQPQAVQTKDNSIISWKLIKVFAIIAIIKVIVFLLLL
jgi:hypothetical protein